MAPSSLLHRCWQDNWSQAAFQCGGFFARVHAYVFERISDPLPDRLDARICPRPKVPQFVIPKLSTRVSFVFQCLLLFPDRNREIVFVFFVDCLLFRFPMEAGRYSSPTSLSIFFFFLVTGNTLWFFSFVLLSPGHLMPSSSHARCRPHSLIVEEPCLRSPKSFDEVAIYVVISFLPFPRCLFDERNISRGSRAQANFNRSVSILSCRHLGRLECSFSFSV